MEDNSRIPILDLLGSAEALYKMREKYRFVVIWGILASLWLIILFVLLILYVILGRNFDKVLIYGISAISIFIGFPLIVTTFWLIPYSLESSRTMENFLLDFKPIWIKMRLELLPAEGSGTIERLTNKIKELDSRFRNARVIREPKQPSTDSNSNFDIFMKKGHKIAVAKLLSDSEEGIQAIQEIKSKTILRAKSLRSDISVLVIASEREFSSEALNWAESDDGLNGVGSICVLVNPVESTFTVKWISGKHRRRLPE